MNLIVAVDKNWAIGYGNKLLVSIPQDMKFFRETTSGKVVVMGRKTLESFPGGQPVSYTHLDVYKRQAFALVFEKGTGIIEKSYDSADLRQAYTRREEGVRQTMDRRSLRRVQGEARTGESRNLLLTTVEGLSLIHI